MAQAKQWDVVNDSWGNALPQELWRKSRVRAYQTGFRNFPDDFDIGESVIDKDGWPEGFIAG